MTTLDRFILPTLSDLEPTVVGLDALGRLATSPLLGGDSPLDSMGVVTVVVSVEARVNEELGTSISLTSERAMSRRHSPFLTLGSLADFIDELLREADA